MALYTSITLLVGLSLVGEHDHGPGVWALIWATTLGLALAHWVAFGLAARIVEPGYDHDEVGRTLAVQVGGSLVVALVASVVVAVVPEQHERAYAQVAIGMLIGAIVLVYARSHGRTWKRSLLGAVAVVAVAWTAVLIRTVLGH
jgi:uncharacterized membrane protein